MKNKLWFKIIVGIVLVYLGLLGIFEFAGLCPEYINRTPRIIMDLDGAESGPGASTEDIIEDIIYIFKLCPSSEIVS